MRFHFVSNKVVEEPVEGWSRFNLRLNRIRGGWIESDRSIGGLRDEIRGIGSRQRVYCG